MNRPLFVPALGSLLAFVWLVVVLHGSASRQAAAEPAQAPYIGAGTMPPTPAASGAPLSADEAHAMLLALAEVHLRPWRQWENSPQRLYSRAAPRPIPTIVVDVKVLPATSEREPFLLATVAITTGDSTQPIACVVDRTTKETRLFADGQWLTGPQWLERSPLPGPRKAR